MTVDCLQAYLLALVQGLTEFLPISSSAHLILLPRLLHLPDQGLAFDVSVHVGTLLAVVLHFRKELLEILSGFLRGDERRLGLAIFVGTVPVGLFGFLGHDLVETALRSPRVIATTTLLFGLLLGLADWQGRGTRSLERLTLRDALLIGFAQALALIPGTSRSGITMTAGLLLGLSREASARFSFLLSIPVILLAGGYESKELLFSQESFQAGLLLQATLVAGLSAYGCIALFLQLIERLGFWPFVLYRLLLAALLFWLE